MREGYFILICPCNHSQSEHDCKPFDDYHGLDITLAPARPCTKCKCIDFDYRGCFKAFMEGTPPIGEKLSWF
jgi:hypothetical protein